MAMMTVSMGLTALELIVRYDISLKELRKAWNSIGAAIEAGALTGATPPTAFM